MINYEDDLFADCRENNHAECMYQYPNALGSVDANQSEYLLTCSCKCHQSLTVKCSTCDNYEELSGGITAQTLIDDNWLLEPVVYCPKCGEDDQKEEDTHDRRRPAQ